MLVHRDVIKETATICSNEIKKARIRRCEEKAVELINKDEKFKQKHRLFAKRFTPISFENAMLEAWNKNDYSFFYQAQLEEAKKFLAILSVVSSEYIDLTFEEAAFIGKWQ